MFYALVILSVFTASLAQMLLKKGASIKHSNFVSEYLNPWVISGYALLGLSLIANIFAMSKGVQVKEVGILESASYLFVPVLSWLCFKERLTSRKIVSIVIILIGISIFFWS